MIQENIKFREIAEHIRAEFIKPHWQPGHKLDSEKKLMDQYGVSRITIRSALQRLEAEGIIAREQGKRSVLLQKPADQKNIRKGINFGLIGNEEIVDASLSDLPRIGINIIRELSSWGATLSLFPFLSEQHPGALDFTRNLISRNLVDGFFVSFTPDFLEIGEYLLAKEIPFVYVLQFQHMMLNFSEGELAGKYCVVQAEELAPTQRLTKRLKDNGTERIVLLGSRDDYFPQRTYDLFKESAGEAGVELISVPMMGTSLKEIIRTVEKYSAPANCLLLSNELVSEFNYAMDYLELSSPKDVQVLLFKHFTPDWSRWEKKYPVFSCDPVKFGEEAARLMYNLILEKESGIPFPGSRIVKLEREMYGRDL